MNNYWESVPGWFDWQDIYDEVAQTIPDGSCVVELGVCLGRSLFYLAAKLEELGKTKCRIYAVDMWENETFLDTVDGSDLVHNCILGSPSFYDAFLTHLRYSGLSNYINVVRAKTDEAFGLVINPEFVFVDASHDYKSVRQDIDLWWPKTRWMAGHDYDIFEGVRAAVSDKFKANFTVRGKCWEVRRPFTDTEQCINPLQPALKEYGA